MASLGVNINRVFRGFQSGKKSLPYVFQRKFSVVTPLVTRNDIFGKSAIDEAVENLEKIPVSRAAIEKCRQAIQGKTVDTWNEKVQVMEQPMIRSDMIERYLTYMQNNYPGITDKLREKLNHLQLEEKPVILIEDKENPGSFEVAYCFVCFGKSSDDTHYACFYAYYTAEIKFTEETAMKGTPLIWGLLQSDEDKGCIEDFFQYKALDGFLKNGVISKINFVQ